MTPARPDRPTDGPAADRSPAHPYGHPYGQTHGHLFGDAPQGAGTRLGSVYRFVLVWLTMTLILWFTTRLLGFERGDVAVAVVCLVVSLAAAVGLTAWLRRRGR